MFHFLLVVATVAAELLNVQVVFRHGDRAPSGGYPTDPHKEDAFPRGYSQLTEIGYAQAEELGEYLSFRYRQQTNLLPDNYNRKQVYVRSSDKDRCIETAMGVISTLFKGERIPVHTYSHHWEDLLLKPNSVHCPLVERIVKLDKTLLRTSLNLEHENVFDFISRHTGMTVDMSNIADVYNAVFRESANGLSQPSWLFTKPYDGLNQTIFDFIVEMKRRDRITSFNSFEKSRLRTGYLLGQLTEEMVKASEKQTKKLISLYATHDATLTSLLYSMDVSNDMLPPYAAAIIFELHKIQDHHFVKILYRNSTSDEPHILFVPGCWNEMCSLEEFETFVAPRSITSRQHFDLECSQILKEKKAKKPFTVASSNLYICLAVFGQALLALHLYYRSISKQFR